MPSNCQRCRQGDCEIRIAPLFRDLTGERRSPKQALLGSYWSYSWGCKFIFLICPGISGLSPSIFDDCIGWSSSFIPILYCCENLKIIYNLLENLDAQFHWMPFSKTSIPNFKPSRTSWECSSMESHLVYATLYGYKKSEPGTLGKIGRIPLTIWKRHSDTVFG